MIGKGTARPAMARGFTVLEVILALSALAILFAIGFTYWRPPRAQIYASSVRNLVLQARFEAIRRNEPVVISWEEDEREFVVRLAGSDDWCGAPREEIARSNAAELGRLTVTTTVVGNGSLVWVPSGQARSCARSPFNEDFADIEDGSESRRIVIGSAGKVEIL
mgnify:CR=1 FL=1